MSARAASAIRRRVPFSFRTGRVRGEDDLRARHAAEDLVRPDGVQRREPIEQQDGNKHGRPFRFE
jgi:hypothetical protein